MDVECSKCGAENIMGAVHCRECGEKLIFELDEALIAGAETKWDKFKKKIPFIITVIIFFLISIPAVSIFFPFMPNNPSGNKLSQEATELQGALKAGKAPDNKKVFYVSKYETQVILRSLTSDKKILFSIEFGKPVIGYLAQYYSVINLRVAAKVDLSGEQPKFAGTKVGYFPAIFGLKTLANKEFNNLKKSGAYITLLRAAKGLKSIKISRSKDKYKRGMFEFTFK